MRLLLICLLIPPILHAQTAEEYYDIATQKYEQGKYYDALSAIDKAIEVNDTSFWYFYCRSLVYNKLEQVDSSLRSGRRALALDPSSSVAHAHIAGLYDAYFQEDSAMIHWNLAIALEENEKFHHAYRLEMAWLRIKLQHYDEAAAELEALAGARPDHAATLNMLAVVYEAQGDTAASADLLRRAIGLDSSKGYVNLARLHTDAGEFDNAMRCFAKAQERSPDHPLLFSNRGYLYYKMGEYDKAIADLNESLRIDRTNSHAYRNRALVYIALGKSEEACRDLVAATYYRFEKYYGDGVKKLRLKHCR